MHRLKCTVTSEAELPANGIRVDGGKQEPELSTAAAAAAAIEGVDERSNTTMFTKSFT